jgi:Asp-tRNA(Asn)/Glu-tRNA(Gln) amidotransferase A subunit family amidase
MDYSELHYLELNEVAHLIQTRKVSPVELTQAMLDRIEKLDRKLRRRSSRWSRHVKPRLKSRPNAIGGRCTASRSGSRI